MERIKLVPSKELSLQIEACVNMPIQQILAVATKKAGSSLPTSVVFTSSPIVDYSSTLLKEVAMPAARPFLLCPCTEKQR